jgi:Flp pilus assembly pilin Flp
MARFRLLHWRSFRRGAPRLRGDESAAVGVEYALLAALVALAIIGSLRGLGVSLANLPLPALIAAFEGALH